MNKAGWHDGILSVHVHEKWGLADMAVLECLMHGANGIWASICEEGAALGKNTGVHGEDTPKSYL